MERRCSFPRFCLSIITRMTQTFSCSACGGPNEPIAGQSHISCSYCGANLTIPEVLRAKAKPTAKSTPPKQRPTPSLEKEAPDLLRKAQPVVVKAWNSYVYWTWLRRLIPACLTMLVISFFVCAAFGALPFVFGLFR